MTLRVRLGEGFQNDTVSVRVDGKQVFQKSGVSTDWTISRADAVDIQVDAQVDTQVDPQIDAPSVKLEVSVQGGPSVVQEIDPARTPFIEVRFVNGELLLLPMGEEPPML